MVLHVSTVVAANARLVTGGQFLPAAKMFWFSAFSSPACIPCFSLCGRPSARHAQIFARGKNSAAESRGAVGSRIYLPHKGGAHSGAADNSINGEPRIGFNPWPQSAKRRIEICPHGQELPIGLASNHVKLPVDCSYRLYRIPGTPSLLSRTVKGQPLKPAFRNRRRAQSHNWNSETLRRLSDHFAEGLTQSVPRGITWGELDTMNLLSQESDRTNRAICRTSRPAIQRGLAIRPSRIPMTPLRQHTSHLRPGDDIRMSLTKHVNRSEVESERTHTREFGLGKAKDCGKTLESLATIPLTLPRVSELLIQHGTRLVPYFQAFPPVRFPQLLQPLQERVLAVGRGGFGRANAIIRN
jgi:hypothetical protein